jgi:hypothetical protein
MYRWIDHTAELELEIEAPTAEEVVPARSPSCSAAAAASPRVSGASRSRRATARRSSQRS